LCLARPKENENKIDKKYQLLLGNDDYHSIESFIGSAR